MSEITITSNAAASKAVVQPDLAKPASSDEKAVSAKPVAQTEETSGVSATQDDQSDELTQNEDDSDDHGADESQQVKKKSGNGFKRKLGKVQAERDYWRDIALQSQAAKNQPQQEAKAEPVHEQKQASKVEAPNKPKPDQFDQYVDYIEALTEWKVEQKELARNENAQKEAQKAEAQKTVQSFETKMQEFKKQAADFDEVVSYLDTYNEVPALREAVLTSDMGPQLAYELAKNPDELDRINALGPAAIFREIGKLEAKLSTSSAPKENKPVKLTNAPKPIAPISTNAGTTAKKTIFEASSQDEYEQIRREQMRAKRA